MGETTSRVYVPIDVRRDLWVAAAGRCEFRGCNRPVDRDFLTKKLAYVGEFAHIIADSPNGPRGSEQKSKELAKDPTNLMLACLECHDRIDRGGKKNDYSVEQLQAMKRDHESRIESIYSADGVKDSLPIIMSFPVGSHLPRIDIRDIHHAMLENCKFTRFPTDESIHIDKADFDEFDDCDEFWARAERAVTRVYETRIAPALTARSSPSHLTIAAFAPIPMLMKLGALIGDKTEASVFDRPGERWLWDKAPNCPMPHFSWDVPEVMPAESGVIISISNSACAPTDIPIVEFKALAPNRGIIRTSQHLQDFRSHFNAMLMKLNRAGVRILHLYPATPLSASVEIGRLLLPKTFEEVHVWEWQAPNWKKALRLN